MDPVTMLVGKYDEQREYRGEANLPEGSASLSGAEFTVEYYGTLSYGSYGDLKAAGVSPARTWVFKTDADGYSEFSADLLVSGDPFYFDSTNTPSLPRGTVVIRETKAPEGYKVNSDFVSFQKIQENVTTSAAVTFNAPEAPEQVVSGGNTKTVGHVEHDRSFLRRRPGRHGVLGRKGRPASGRAKGPGRPGPFLSLFADDSPLRCLFVCCYYAMSCLFGYVPICPCAVLTLGKKSSSRIAGA